MIDKNARIFIAGHRGMVGSAIVRKFESEGFKNIIVRTHAELDLRNQDAVERFYREAAPEYVVLGAAKVGGIRANMEQKAEFMVENLEIQNNVIMGAHRHGVRKLCFLGSSCIYPCQCPQPIREDYLLTGPLEPTNEGYALAKISGYKLCLYLHEEYGMQSVSLMPCNLYGTNDNYHPEHSHVFPALIRRFTEAAENGTDKVTLWGDGSALREFLHVDDVARAVGGYAALVDLKSHAATARGLAFMDYDAREELLQDALLLRTPVVRAGKGQAAVGLDEAAWKLFARGLD